MKNNCIYTPLLISLLTFLIIEVNGAEVLEEETTPKYVGAAQKKTYEKAEVTKGGKAYKTKFLFSASQGFDNNVFLDSSRKGDTFSEGIFDANIVYPLTGRWDIFGGLGVHDITYWEFTDTNLVDADFKFGFEGKLFGNFVLTGLNNVEVVEYPYNEDGSYVGDKVSLKLKHNLPKTLLPATFFHGLGYEYFYKNYEDRKARNGYGVKSPNDRADKRNTFSQEFGAYFKKAMLKLNAEYYVNDSNDQYFNYYDYHSRRFRLSFIYLFTDKMTAMLSVSQQRKFFLHRITQVDSTSREADNIFMGGASLFYEIYKNTSLGLNYSYRENDSNDPIQEYSGSITSLGLYCRF